MNATLYRSMLAALPASVVAGCSDEITICLRLIRNGSASTWALLDQMAADCDDAIMRRACAIILDDAEDMVAEFVASIASEAMIAGLALDSALFDGGEG